MHCAKSLISVFQEYFDGIKNPLFWQENWSLGYHALKFRYFHDIF